MATLVLSNVMKKFENLNVIDNFMFNELETQTDRESAKEFVRILLETILEKKVSNIRIFSQLLEQGRMPGMHGIQMDSYVEACVGEGEDEEQMIFPIKPEVFDIEPNTYETDSEEKRMRYYRALIDTKILASGVKYQNMKNVTLIMISTYDPFKRDRMMYTIENVCKEEPDLKYDDGVRTLFLYVHGKKGTENQALVDLLRYMADSRAENVTNPDIETIQKMMDKIKRSSEIGVRYMQSWEIKQICHDEGYSEGYSEGHDTGYGEGYGNGYDNGYNNGAYNKLVADVENAMKHFHVDLQTACEGLETTVAQYENAKKMLSITQ